jgi:hypothetical protein
VAREAITTEPANRVLDADIRSLTALATTGCCGCWRTGCCDSRVLRLIGQWFRVGRGVHADTVEGTPQNALARVLNDLAMEVRQKTLEKTSAIENAQFALCKGSASWGADSASITQNFCIPIFRPSCQNSKTHSPDTISHGRSNLNSR